VSSGKTSSHLPRKTTFRQANSASGPNSKIQTGKMTQYLGAETNRKIEAYPKWSVEIFSIRFCPRATTSRGVGLNMEETRRRIGCRVPFCLKKKIGPLIINMLHGWFLERLWQIAGFNFGIRV
jgi:hypothetical protein